MESEPLGSNTKTATPPEENALYALRLVKRFQLLGAVRRLLKSHSVTRRDGVQPHRTNGCYVWKIKASEMVECIVEEEKKRAYYGNVMRCSSVWSCPVCAARISERRRQELKTGLGNAKKSGWGYAMGTWTIQHNKFEPCQEVLNNMLLAYRKSWSGMPAKRIRRRGEIIGQIRALETTYSENGWHCHIHSILVFERPKSSGQIDDLSKVLKKRWGQTLEKIGRYASVERGFVMEPNERSIGDYIAKFGLDSVDGNEAKERKAKGEWRASATWSESEEATKYLVKRSKAATSETVSDLLHNYWLGDPQSGERWIEYLKAFTGKSQLLYSAGLKELLGLKGDEEADDEPEAMGIVLAQLHSDQWARVVELGGQGELLARVARNDTGELEKLFAFWKIGGVIFPSRKGRE